MLNPDRRLSPLVLTVPGLGGSGPDHWQSIWERERSDVERIELGCWDEPDRNHWVAQIDAAVNGSPGPVILAAHSLGCLAVAWWAHFAGDGVAGPVAGALLVAPPDVDRGADGRVCRFAPTPHVPLPFPSILVASSDDPWASLPRLRAMAGAWLSDFVEVGAKGHINAASGLGRWEDGERLLDRLADGVVAGAGVTTGRVPA